MPQLSPPTPAYQPALKPAYTATEILRNAMATTESNSISNGHASGETTPECSKTISTVNDAHRLKRTDSEETLLTVLSGESEGTVMSESSRIYPPVPANTPLARSVAGDPLEMRSRIANLTARLKKAMPPLTQVTPPASTIDETEGKPVASAIKCIFITEPIVRDFATSRTESAMSCMAAAREATVEIGQGCEKLHRLTYGGAAECEVSNDKLMAEPDTLSAIPEATDEPEVLPATRFDTSSTTTKTQIDSVATNKSTPAVTAKIFPEHTTWADMAEEDVAKGLLRLFRVARDEHQLDPGKPVEHYYSLRLAKLLKGGEIRFDPAYLS